MPNRDLKSDEHDPSAASATPRADAKAMWTLWLIVFVDLIGFGILTPLIPFYVLRTNVGVEMVTLIVAAYSLTQFICMPFWGSLSDRIGRRPVLFMSMAGHVATYAMLGFVDTWWMLLAVRVLGGATAANLATAYAYAADVTPKADHAKAFGKISAAFGLGFVVGPVFGGMLAGGNAMTEANFLAPALAAAGLSALSCLAIWLFLPESRQPDAPGKPQKGYFAALRGVSGQPIIVGLIGLAVAVIFCMSMRESILPIWVHDLLGLTPREIGLIIATTGGVIVAMQFFAMGPLSQAYGSANLVKASFFFFALSWGGLILAQDLIHVLTAAAIGAMATALFQTNVQALFASQAGPQERGLFLGAYQSASALSRFAGQALVGSIYVLLGMNAPFLIGAFMMVPVMIYFWYLARLIHGAANARSAPAE